jgi:hypothetical protein
MRKGSKRAKQTAKRKTTAKKNSARRKRPAAITISRSSGRKEKFNIDKMAQTTARSGVPFLMARDVAKSVSRKLKAEAKGRDKKTVTGGRVRNMIARELHERGQQTIASSYAGDTPENIQKEGNTSKIDPSRSLIGTGDSDSVLHDKSKRLSSVA